MERGVFPSTLLIIWHTLVIAADIVVGIKTHSLCPIVHCLHTAFIVIEEIIRLVCFKFRHVPNASRPPDQTNTFGWARGQVLGITINSVLLAALCFSRMVTALKRLVVWEHLHDPLLVIVTGGIGVASAIVVLFATFIHEIWQEKCRRREGRAEGEPCRYVPDIPGVASSTDIDDRNLAPPKPKKRRTFTNMLVAVVLALDGFLIMYLPTDQNKSYTDTSLSIVMVIIIIIGTFPKLMEASYVLLQAVPGHMKVEIIEAKMLRAIPSIDSIHEFHLWQLTGNHVVATLHVCIRMDKDFDMVASEVERFLHKKGVHSVTVQPEFVTEETAHSDTNFCHHDCGPRCQKQKCCPNKVCAGHAKQRRRQQQSACGRDSSPTCLGPRTESTDCKASDAIAGDSCAGDDSCCE